MTRAVNAISPAVAVRKVSTKSTGLRVGRVDEAGHFTPVSECFHTRALADEEADKMNKQRDNFELDEGYYYEARQVGR